MDFQGYCVFCEPDSQTVFIEGTLGEAEVLGGTLLFFRSIRLHRVNFKELGAFRGISFD